MLTTRLTIGSLMVTGAVAVFVADGYFAPYFPLLWLLSSAAIWLAARELAVLLSPFQLGIHPFACAVGTLFVAWSVWLPTFFPSLFEEGPRLLWPIVSFVFLSTLVLTGTVLTYSHDGKSVQRAAGYILAFFYLGVLGSMILSTRWVVSDPWKSGSAFGLVIFLPKVCDIGAYFSGKAFGRNKLAPLISPGKTWEGVLGGVILTVALAGSLPSLRHYASWLPSLTLGSGLFLGATCGVMAVLGDLVESVIKRDGHQKDASQSIPGFGGVLDVLDSIIFAGPFVRILLAILAQEDFSLF